ncbi:heavy metal sensor histidine kinase [Pandoraea pulmonicola]|uniref:heavy metal sensor histidine kinase n=1 Tax=Pandoraea pulmonicola TaxID=93221 RepID=UPI00057DBE5C|nr:heavy metal sensor histidine kinase [Pandoraea pulmonicola]
MRARLTLFVAGCMFTVLALMATYQYFALAEQLRARAHQDLLGTVNALRSELSGITSKAQIGADPRRWYDATHGHQNLDFAVLDVDGKTLIASRGYRPPVAALSRVSSDKVPDERDVQKVANAELGVRLRYIAADGVIGVGGARGAESRPGAHVTLVVQLDPRDQVNVLAGFALTAVVAQIIGTLIVGAMAYWLVTLGLKPLRQLTHAAEQVSSERMSTPLAEDDTPAELRDLSHAFNRMLARLNESFTRLSQFSSDLAHDIRTPISNLMGEAQVALSRDRTPAEYKAVLESSVEECERLSHMISSMLFLARTESAHTEIRRESTALEAIAGALADDFSPMAEDAGLTLDVQGRASAQVDRGLVRRALSNVLGNAIRHARRGSVITIRCVPAPGWGEVQVHNACDAGNAIAPEHLPRIFDRLYRVDPSRHIDGDPRSGGTGLGLAIVKSIMALHGGTVTARSDALEGTVFVLRFPAIAPAGPEASKIFSKRTE